MNLNMEQFLFDDNKLHSLKEFSCKKGYVLFFFPKVGTSECTLEIVGYNQNYQTFIDAGYSVIGISRDPARKQHKFKVEKNIKFPLLCDVDLRICHYFQVLKEKKMFNNTYLGIVRSTFLLDQEFKILAEWRNVKALDHIGTVLAKATLK